MASALIFGTTAPQPRYFPVNGALGINFYLRSGSSQMGGEAVQVGTDNTVWFEVYADAADVAVGPCGAATGAVTHPTAGGTARLVTDGGSGYDNPVLIKRGEYGWVKKDGGAF